MMKEMENRYLILGGGISGLTLGWKLASAGAAAEILEASCRPGGLAGTLREDGYSLDFGPHSFFSEDEEISRTVRELFDPPLKGKTRRVKFYFEGNYLDYPLTAFHILFQMGPGPGLRALLSLLKAKLFDPEKAAQNNLENQSVEEWAKQNFGDYLYQTFFKPYTEQFWKIPACELSARSIPSHTRLSFLKTLGHLLKKYNGVHSLSIIDRERLPTYYPSTGYGEISERMANRFLSRGGRLRLSCRVTGIHQLPDGGFEIEYEKEGREKWAAGHCVISTLPLPILIHSFDPPPPAAVLEAASKLDYRPLLMLGMATQKQNILPCDYLYLLHRPYNRITEMNKFSERTSPEGENILAAEIPCRRGDEIWNASKEKLFERCIESLSQDGFLKRQDVSRLLLVKAPYAYPIYRKNYAGHLAALMEFIQNKRNFYTLGRSGEFLYGDADQCMRRAFDLAEKLLNGEKILRPETESALSPAEFAQ